MKKTLLLVCFLLAAACTPKDRYIQITGQAQGGTYSVKLNMKGVRVSPETIRDSVQSLLVKIDTTLSGYNKGSLLSRFNAGESIRPNQLFLDTYELAYVWYQRSGGLLDCAAGPLFDAWGFGFREGKLPSEDAVKEILGSCGMGRLSRALPLQEDGTLNPADVPAEGGALPRLNFNAIAQGYTADLVAAYLYSIGVQDMLVDIGEIWCDGLNPDGKPWMVGVDRPFDRPADGTDTLGQELEGIWTGNGSPCGIVTSGNYRKYYVKDGKKYAHTINPVSGYPAENNLLSATVLSTESSAAADAVATWCMVVGLEAAQALVLADDTLEGYLIYAAEDGSMAEWASPGFRLTSN